MAEPSWPWRRWHLAALTALSAYSTGVGWQAQLVSYPLYRAVGPADFAAYHRQYNKSIPLVVIVPGFLTFLTQAAFYWTRPPDVPRPVGAGVSGAGMLSLASTVLWAIPMHDRLDSAGPSADTIDSLLRANAVRTAALTAATGALMWCLARSKPGRSAGRNGGGEAPDVPALPGSLDGT